MVDANGGYTAGQARRVGAALDELGVAWFEEPVSSDDLDGLAPYARRCAATSPPGSTSPTLYEAARLCPVVDCLQLDVTRCGGYTGWLRGAAVAAGPQPARLRALRPALHAPVAAAVPNLRHVEWFIDHARLEPLLVDGAPTVQHGALHPDHGAPATA